MRKHGLVPLKTYEAKNKLTGKSFGVYKIGALGGLNPINRYNDRKTEIIRSIDRFDFIEKEGI